MKLTIILMALLSVGFGQAARSEKTAAGALQVEIRTNSDHVHTNGEIVVTVLFRSPGKEISVWNALDWGAPFGLYLRVLDSSGKAVQNEFSPLLHPFPPDLDGKDALISIGGSVFAGFDSRIAVKSLFPKPGRYTIHCLYVPPLSRNYFRGRTIWGKEDGPVSSIGAPVFVE